MNSGTFADSDSEKSDNHQIRDLLDFINRLGNASRGLGAEVDQYLSKIKAASQTGSPETRNLSPLLHQASQAIHSEYRKIEHQVQNAHERARQATRQLDAQLSQHRELKTEKEQLKLLMERLDTPLYSYIQILALTLELLDLYQAAAINKQDSTDSSGQNSQDYPYDLLQSELASLLASIEFQGTPNHSLQNLRQRLTGKLSAGELMQVCIESLQLVIRGINDERHAAQEFLLSLNDSLESVQKALERALHTNDNANQKQHTLGLTLREHVHNLSDSIQRSHSLQDLKQLTISHLEALNTTLNEKLELEAEQRKFLALQLAAMQARLEDVESEAQMYKRKLSEQKFKSLQDSLTRLPNRAAFEERLQLEFQRWQNYASPLCIAIVDIDHFKKINDSYGHTAGDKTLQVIANMLKKSMRETDFVCRYGGEEFVIVFPQTTTDIACELLEKARHRIKGIPFKFKNTNISITMSAGVSCFIPSDTPITVFERADRALYDAKNQGRDRVCQP